jgi:hypothetical protein
MWFKDIICLHVHVCGYMHTCTYCKCEFVPVPTNHIQEYDIICLYWSYFYKSLVSVCVCISLNIFPCFVVKNTILLSNKQEWVNLFHWAIQMKVISDFHHKSPYCLKLHNTSYHKYVRKSFTHPHSSFIRGAMFRNSLTSLTTSSPFLWHIEVHSSGGECSLSLCTTRHVSGSVRLLEQSNGAVESQIYKDPILV